MYWRTVKHLLKNSSPTYSLPPICAHENDTVYKFEDQEKAQLLNDYFCSIATLDLKQVLDGSPIHFYVCCLEVRKRFAYFFEVRHFVLFLILFTLLR
jgi:hypothetical protein